MLNRFTVGVALGLAVLAATAWGLYGRAWSARKAAYTHLYCPGCDVDIPFDAKKVGKKCSFCSKENPVDPPELIPAIGRGDKRILATGTSSFGTHMVFLVVLLVVFQLEALLWYYHRRDLRRQEEAVKNRVLVCRCPFCRRKIGYTAARIGLGVACPRCKTAFVLPLEDEAEAVREASLPPSES
jgi:hypothetical protein